MKQDYTEIVVLLDRSGSMQHGKDDHEGGLMSFVEDQQQLEGNVRFTLIQFDNVEPCEIVYDGVPIADVDQIKLIPRGGTPLLDAVGLTIAHVAERLADTKPDQVVVMIITDGQENFEPRVQARAGQADDLRIRNQPQLEVFVSGRGRGCLCRSRGVGDSRGNRPANGKD